MCLLIHFTWISLCVPMPFAVRKSTDGIQEKSAFKAADLPELLRGELIVAWFWCSLVGASTI